MYFEEVIAEIAMFMFLFHAQHDVLRFSNNKKNEILWANKDEKEYIVLKGHEVLFKYSKHKGSFLW